jgi:drug/metabolite transporter (DMT)-like permease
VPSLGSTSRSSALPVTFGFGSHFLAGGLPFISSGAITRLGLMPGTATLYAAGTLVLLASLVRARTRQAIARETRALFAPGLRRPFVLGLAGFLVAGVGYYIGLANSPRVAEYVFLTRLDWLIQAPIAILILREPWTRSSVAGGALALAGGLIIAWTGSIGTSGLVAAIVYVLASLVGYSLFKRIAAARGTAGAIALTMWRHWVNTAGFVLLALTIGSPTGASTAEGLWLAAAAGVVIVVLFLLRFTALTGIPLWVLSVQAPTQGFVAIAITLATGGSLPARTLAAIAMIVVGEVLVTRARWRNGS